MYTQLDLEERVDAAVKTAVENAAESLQAHVSKANCYKAKK